jgi:predicted ATPase
MFLVCRCVAPGRHVPLTVGPFDRGHDDTVGDGLAFMTFDDTVSFGHALGHVYERAGYVLVEVPQHSIAG